MAKGQAAIEYLALIGFILVVATPLLLQAQQSASGLQESTNQLKAATMLDTVEEAATLVYSQGEPAQITFDVEVPRGVLLEEVKNQHIRVRVDGKNGASDYIRTLSFNVTGSLPTSQGRHVLVAEAVGRTNVTIYEK